MRNLIIVALTLVSVLGAPSAASANANSDRHDAVRARAAAASHACVGSGHRCYAQIQPAVEAAGAGETIRIGAGTFAGGVTIDKDLRIVGAGADATIIKGGGPVLTIGAPDAQTEPTVTIDGVTVMGGNTVGNLTPADGRGGGIYIPRAAGPATGATVTIRDSVIRDNRVAPAQSTDSGLPCDCPFASAGGGGISNDGTLTLIRTVVTGNRADGASGLTSDSDGAGILNRAFGNLTLRKSSVTDNRADVTAPNGRFADGGGILMVAGSLNVEDSLVAGNTATVDTDFASGVDTAALAGGIHSEAGASAVIRTTTVTGNTAAATNPVGDPIAFCGGICTDGSLLLRQAGITGNRVIAGVAGNATSTGNASADSGGLGIGCCEDEPTSVTLSGTRLSGNRVSATAAAGDAFAAAGAVSMANTPAPTIDDSTINDNAVTATSATGSVTLRGAGLENGGLVDVRNTTVRANVGTASAPSGVAEGGGIWNGAFDPSAPDPGLRLTNSAITQNTLNASPGIDRRGGGLFTTAPVTIRTTAIAHNAPDQCYGC
jgi:hypothetical protein